MSAGTASKPVGSDRELRFWDALADLLAALDVLGAPPGVVDEAIRFGIMVAEANGWFTPLEEPDKGG